MIRLFKDVKAHLRKVGGETGFSATDERVKTWAELAQERLLQEGNWPGTLQRMGLQTFGGVITLPDEYETLYAVRRSDVGAIEITDNWFDLLPQNSDPIEYAPNTAEDLGEWAVVRHPEGRYIKAFSNDPQVITVIADGETIELTPGSWDEEATATTKKYNFIERVERAGPGTGFEIVYDDEDGVETFGARFSGLWDSATLRSYNIGNFSKVADVVARRRVPPVTGDNSKMIISNIPALRLAIMSIAREDAGMIDESEALLQRAINSMMSENKRYHPHHQQPRIQPTMSMGDIPQL